MATLTKGKTFTNGELVTPQKLHELVDLSTVSGIVNADIAAGADIADTKLATISTAGKVSNSATTATSANAANAIVARDASGNFSAGTITANLTGNASSATTAAACTGNAATATKLATARTITLGGDLSGSVSFDGSANATLTAAVADDSHNHVISNIDGLQTALDGKQVAGSYAAASHTHDDRYYTETEMNTLLAAKQAAGSYAAASHTHAASAITTGQLDNARTTATSLNIANTIVLRDNSKSIWADTVNATQVIPKGGSLIFNDTFGTDFQFLGNSNDNKLFLKASGSEILEIDNTNGYPIWKIKNDFGSRSKIGIFKDNPLTALDVNGTITATALDVNGTITGSFSGSANLSDSTCVGKLDFGQSTSYNPNRYLGFFADNIYVGAIVRNGSSSVSYSTSSDYRLKTNLEPLTDAVARLLQIPVHRFNWVADPNAPKVDGFLAHEAQAIVPESVTGTKDEVDAEGKPVHQGIDQSKLVPLLVAAVQELAARVAALEAR